MYSQTQYGKWIIAISLIFAIVIIYWYDELKNSDPIGEIASVSTLVFFFTIALLFYRLKVVVHAREIVLSFGIGVIQKRIAIKHIRAVEPVKNSFWFGWGIRLTPYGWLWNISGYDAVELTFKDRKEKFRIGCADSAELASAIARNLGDGNNLS